MFIGDIQGRVDAGDDIRLQGGIVRHVEDADLTEQCEHATARMGEMKSRAALKDIRTAIVGLSYLRLSGPCSLGELPYRPRSLGAMHARALGSQRRSEIDTRVSWVKV